MDKAVEMLRQDLNSLHAGRASTAIVERIMVEAYNTKMPLLELATISIPDTNQIAVTPFDQAVLRNIVKAISDHSELHLSANIDENNVIRISLPPLTMERRQELVKIVKQKLEAARIMIRQVRSEKMREIKDATEAKTVNEDEGFRAEQDLQKLTEEFNKRIEDVGKAKEEELLEV